MPDNVTISEDYRNLTVPQDQLILGCVGDAWVRRVYFTAPRYYDGTDLSGYDFTVQFVNEAGVSDLYEVEDLATDTDTLTFSWLVSPIACANVGKTEVSVIASNVDDETGETLNRLLTTTYPWEVLPSTTAADGELIEAQSYVEMRVAEWQAVVDTNTAAIASLSDIIPASSFTSTNTVKSYVEKFDKAFDTVADMQADTTLSAGMICHTLGFHAVGDGGAAWYKVESSGTANGMDVLALDGGLIAVLNDESSANINPLQYGLKVNINDTAATNAITRILAKYNGGTILFPEGIIYLNEITIPPNKIYKFVGQGSNWNDDNGTTLTPLTNTQTSIFKADSNGNDFCEFISLNFNGESSCQYGINGSMASAFLVDKCCFVDFTKTSCLLGLGLNRVRNSIIKALSNADSALTVHSDGHITNCEIVGGKSSLAIEYSGFRITSCLIERGSEHSISLVPTARIPEETTPQCNNVLINGCYFGAVPGYHIAAGSNCNNLVIVNNYFECTQLDVNEGAISLNTNKSSIISNNIIYGYGTAVKANAIYLVSCDNTIVSNNKITQWYGKGIVLNNCIDNTVTGNNFRDLNDTAIDLNSGSQRNIISANSNQNGGSYSGNALEVAGANNIVFGNKYGSAFNIASSSINMPFNDDTGSVELNVTATETVNVIKRLNGVVYINLITSGITGGASAGSKVATIPSSFRANETIWFTNSVGTFDNTLYTDSNGGIYTREAIPSGEVLRINLTYIQNS